MVRRPIIDASAAGECDWSMTYQFRLYLRRRHARFMNGRPQISQGTMWARHGTVIREHDEGDIELKIWCL